MKITKWATFEKEMEVNICAEECASAIHEDPLRLQTCLMGLNNCATFMKAVPDTVISEMNPAQKKSIEEFFRTQSERYK